MLKRLKKLKKGKIIRAIKWILAFLLIFLALIIIFSTHWSLINFQFNNFDQILFTLTSSVASASNDLIEEFIKELFNEADDYVEIQRNDLAEQFNCVPSQINYVLMTRFTIDKRYYIDSKKVEEDIYRLRRLI